MAMRCVMEVCDVRRSGISMMNCRQVIRIDHFQILWKTYNALSLKPRIDAVVTHQPVV
jgi:hypothetical protein